MGAALLLVIPAFCPPTNSLPMSDTLVVGGAFIISCIFGIYAALKPDRIFLKGGSRNNRKSHYKMKGHHPDCELFERHVIRISNGTLCPGCTGLALGSVISILLMSGYIVCIQEMQQFHLYIGVLLGMVCIALVYMEIVIPARNAYLHLISNVFLIISFFFIVIGTLQLTNNMTCGLIAIVISYLWLDTRVRLSEWRHSRVCTMCREPCCAV